MKITVITLFPKMISGFIDESIIKRAKDKGAVEIELVNLRDFAVDEYGSVDDRPYGGGAGMVLRVEPIFKAIKNIQKIDNQKIVLTSPKGRQYSQKVAQKYSKLDHLVIIAGHYEETDERVRDYIDEEVSLGDFVMTGGEITAAAVIDSVVRLLPTVLKKEEATQSESFFKVKVEDLIKLFPDNNMLNDLRLKNIQEVSLLEYPQYTRPEEFDGKKVPEILLSGHKKNIEEWQIKKAFQETLNKRPDLLQ